MSERQNGGVEIKINFKIDSTKSKKKKKTDNTLLLTELLKFN